MIKEGIINFNKPAGMTSHDCVNRLRRLTGVKRIGHTGTLDPQATGVLPLCIGGAARVNEYLDLDYKTYRCEAQLGLVTETQDVWGAALSDQREELRRMRREGALFTAEEAAAAFLRFTGVIEQTPPKYSAVRIGGRRLYEYARAGEEVEIKSRRVHIRSLAVEAVDLDALTVVFTVECSKGTYIRTICQDAGDLLGCGAAMSGLTRTASGAFTFAEAVGLEALADAGVLENAVRPVDEALLYFGTAVLAAADGRKFINGIAADASIVSWEAPPAYRNRAPAIPVREEFTRAYKTYMESEEGRSFLGVAFYDAAGGRLVPDKVFYKQEAGIKANEDI